MKPQVEAIDLFCGVGGLTHGLRESGIDVVAGLDNDRSCKDAYENNNGGAEFIHADISGYDFRGMKGKYSRDSVKVLAGCAPCQPFSPHLNKYMVKKDSRWGLIDCFLEAVEVLNPDVVPMENVRGLSRQKIFKDFCISLDSQGYEVSHGILSCPDYGIPQRRSRLVLIASKFGKAGLPQKTHTKEEHATVRDAIESPHVEDGGGEDPLGKSINLSEINIRRIKQSKPNGTWRDWDKDLLPDCYKRDSGKTYTCVYGRMDWDDLAPTITTQFFNYGSGRFGHPVEDRALTLREGALLQTFPHDYDFGSKICFVQTGKHIGNAVPPKLAKEIGKAILQHIREAI